MQRDEISEILDSRSESAEDECDGNREAKKTRIRVSYELI